MPGQVTGPIRNPALEGVRAGYMQHIDVQGRIDGLIYIHSLHAKIISLIDVPIGIEEIEIKALFPRR